MANTAQSKKRIRRNTRFEDINGARRRRIRTFIKKVEVALQAGNAEQAQEAFQIAQPELMRGVSKGVLHKNTAARKISRLSQRIKTLKAS